MLSMKPGENCVSLKQNSDLQCLQYCLLACRMWLSSLEITLFHLEALQLLGFELHPDHTARTVPCKDKRLLPFVCLPA